GRTRTDGQSREFSTNTSDAVTKSWGVKHTPFMEYKPEFYTLEEQRWRAADVLMRLPVGHWFFCNEHTFSPGSSKLPSGYFLAPRRFARLEDNAYAQHNISPE